jgi:FeS assembly SUF system protein
VSQPAESNRPARLRVLRSGDKVEQLRQQPTAGDAASSGATDVTTNATTPLQCAILDRVVEALKTVYDPELPLNIYDLGLIYSIDVDDAGSVRVRMTLTAPACPVAGSLPGEIRDKIAAVEGVTAADVELVWDPPWTRDRLSEEAKLELGLS